MARGTLAGVNYVNAFIYGEDLTSGDPIEIYHDKGIAKVRRVTDFENFFGIVQKTAKEGTKNNVAILGEKSTIYSGQIPGSILYIQRDGSLSTNVSNFPVGRFTSPKELYVSNHPESVVEKVTYLANEILEDIKEIDKKYKTMISAQLDEDKKYNLDTSIKRKLDETNWSMLADAPLSQEGKALYRQYRQYLRDIFKLYENKQILELTIMTFDEWRENPPKYKVVIEEII